MVHRSMWLCCGVVLAACMLAVPAAQQAAYSLTLGYKFVSLFFSVLPLTAAHSCAHSDVQFRAEHNAWR